LTTSWQSSVKYNGVKLFSGNAAINKIQPKSNTLKTQP